MASPLLSTWISKHSLLGEVLSRRERVTGPPILLSYFVTVVLDEPSSTTLINQQLIKPQWVQQKPQKGMAPSPHPC